PGGSSAVRFAGVRRAARFEPGLGLGFLRRFDRRLGRGLALRAKFLDQLRAIVAAFGHRLAGFLAGAGAGALGGFGDRRVELALRAQAERDRVLRLDVLDIPVAAVADRVDRVARGADQLADLRVGNLRVVAQ